MPNPRVSEAPTPTNKTGLREAAAADSLYNLRRITFCAQRSLKLHMAAFDVAEAEGGEGGDTLMEAE